MTQRLDRDAPWFRELVERIGEPRLDKGEWLTWNHGGRHHFINVIDEGDILIELNIFSKGRLTWECRKLPDSDKMRELLAVTEFGESW